MCLASGMIPMIRRWMTFFGQVLRLIIKFLATERFLFFSDYPNCCLFICSKRMKFFCSFFLSFFLCFRLFVCLCSSSLPIFAHVYIFLFLFFVLVVAIFSCCWNCVYFEHDVRIKVCGLYFDFHFVSNFEVKCYCYHRYLIF